MAKDFLSNYHRLWGCLLDVNVTCTSSQSVTFFDNRQFTPDLLYLRKPTKSIIQLSLRESVQRVRRLAMATAL